VFFLFSTGNIEPNQYVIKIIIRTFVLHPKTVEIQSPPHHLTITNLTTSPSHHLTITPSHHNTISP
ncbi:MAG: hypothetical protein SOY92_00925, partial [Prevotella sp.]|nr:hypothetical protein [Prevotella sp.]